MNLPRAVAKELGIDQAQAERGLSAVFLSIRMAVDPPTFGEVTKAFPNASVWLRDIELGGGRTGEILALAGPEALRRQLKAAGFTDKDIQQLGPMVNEALRSALSPAAYEQVVARVPLLKGAP